MNELDLFVAAVAIPDPASRAAFLDRECGADSALRRRLDALLAGHERSRHPLDHPPAAGPAAEATVSVADFTATRDPDGTRSRPSPLEAVGTVIAGRYKLRQQIGEGGMGTVWMADQTEPVKRKVAVKLIRVERGQSKTILARFEAERQAIALMDHPHIAKLLDAGTTETGSPFFVMELVKGIPLNDFCDQHKLTIAERLNLFQQICGAVQHAHQKGIIHRDLKPGNILVESHDGKPVPKVIDFGLAKATTGLQLSEQSMFTAFGSVMGTPLYMAPEQATFNAVDVDTRADVYALGAILYEMLTGTTPITRDTLKKAALDEMLRLVREQEAPTPSSRLSSADSLPSVSANRQTEPQKLGRFVKGELDWIVLKALSKDRDRRYETANGFAKDIERFLNHEPVSAGPPSTRYRLQKFVQRNRGQVIAASLVLCALLAGIAGTTVGLFEAKRQERLAVAAQQAEAERAEGERLAKLDAQDKETLAITAAAAEKAAKLDAEAKRKEAERNLAYARKGNDILGSVFGGLDPRKIAESGRPLQDVLRENLVKAVKELDGSSLGDPLEVAVMQEILGESLVGLGESGLAIEVFAKVWDTRKAMLGPGHPHTLTTMNNLAVVYRGAGKLDLALPLYEETLKLSKAKLGPDHLESLKSMYNLAGAYREAGKLDLALPLYEETLKLQKAKLGPDHLDTLKSTSGLAVAYQAAGKDDLALPLHEETLKLIKAKLGPNHPDTLTSMGNLASAYQNAGKLDLALSLHEETLKLRKAKLGPNHPDTLTSMANLATAYWDARKLDLALSLLEETLTLRKAKLGPDHPSTLTSMGNLAVAYQAAGKRNLALPLYEETLKLRKATLGLEHPDTLLSMNKLANVYWDAGKLDRALPLYEETLKLRKIILGPDHPDTLQSMNNLALGYDVTGQFDKAEFLHRERLPLVKQKSGAESPDYAIALATLGLNLLHQKKWTEAEPLLRECLTIREKSQPDAWSTFNIQSLLGGAMLGQKKYAEAEPLLLKGYEGLKTREKMIPQNGGGELRIPEALDRLIELYNETNKPDEVKKWQAERAKYPTPKEVAPPPKEKK